MTSSPSTHKQDAALIGVVGLAHGVSHFFHLLLPPLFPWLMAEFGLDFTGIGATMTVFFVVSGLGQALAGLWVDRFGPARVLAAGMSCFVMAGVALSFAHSYVHLCAVAALAGLGNSVFHPADYSLLNRRVASQRLGHAFSVHGLSGNIGWGLAPLFLTGLASWLDWRTAALAAGCLALPFVLLFTLARPWLEGADWHQHHTHDAQGSRFAFLQDRTVWMCFAFFFFLTVAFGAIQNFASPLLGALYGLSRASSASVLSAYLFAGGAGIILGGFLAHQRAQEKVIAAALLAAAALAVVLAWGVLPAWSILPVMAGIGFLSGCAGPSRDLLVRRAATARYGQGAFGRIYGFVYSGLDTGLATAPLIFGQFMDQGRYSTVLVGIAILQVCTVFTALGVGKRVAP